MSASRIAAFGRLLCSAVLLLTLSRCGDDAGGSLADLGVRDGASQGLSESMTVTADEPVRIQLKTGALLDVPAGAVSKELKVTMERPADAKALKLIDKLPKSAGRVVSAPYVITPHGTKFDKNVTVTLPLAKSGSRNLSVVWLEDEDDTEWKVIGKPKSNGEKAAIDVRHFSVLMLVEDASGLGSADDPDASADDADAGDQVTDAGGDGDDAGSIAPSLDAGTSARDGGVDVAADATASEVDAGLGAAPEGGTGAADAGTTTAPDAGTGGGDAGAGGFYTMLSQCGLIAQPGNFSEGDPYVPHTLCIATCFLKYGTCGDLYVNFCNLGDGTLTQPTADCLTGCSNFTCPDQTSAFTCDNVAQCANGEDEVGCEPTFACAGGGDIAFSKRCDGARDCTGGEDEVGCFYCLDQTTIPPEYVCDVYPDCSDGSDEQGKCAQLDCSTVPAQ